MNYLEEFESLEEAPPFFEEEPHELEDFLVALIIAPIGIPVLLLRKMLGY